MPGFSGRCNGADKMLFYGASKSIIFICHTIGTLKNLLMWCGCPRLCNVSTNCWRSSYRNWVYHIYAGLGQTIRLISLKTFHIKQRRLPSEDNTQHVVEMLLTSSDGIVWKLMHFCLVMGSKTICMYRVGGLSSEF